MRIKVKDEELILDKERAIYFPQQQLLAISDLHLGKAAHFRKAGLQVPSTLAQSDLSRLQMLIKKYEPTTLLINGDMFHHDINTDIDDFEKWRIAHSALKFVLVKGNHDKLNEVHYQKLGISVYDPSFSTSKFCFIHEALSCKKTALYPISGHIHPGVSIIGKAKQRLRLPCFYFGNDFAVMPAFSAFTGLCIIKPKSNEQVYAITPKSVIRI